MIKAVRFCRAAFSFSPDRKGDVRGTAFKVKASLELPRKPIFWLACFGRLYEKESGFHGCEQARPDGLRSLFLRAAAKRVGPHYCAAAAASPSRSFFPQKKRRNLSRKSPKRQSAELCSAGLRSKLKKGTEAEGRACSHTRVQSPFSTNCRDKNAASFQYKRRFFGTFLTQESTVLPRLLRPLTAASPSCGGGEYSSRPQTSSTARGSPGCFPGSGQSQPLQCPPRALP